MATLSVILSKNMDKVELLRLYHARELRENFIITEYLRLRRTCLYRSTQQISKVIAQLPCSFFMVPLRMADMLYNVYILNRSDVWHTSFKRVPLRAPFVARMKELYTPGANKETIIHDAICSPAPNVGLGWNRILKIIRRYEKTKKLSKKHP